MNNEKEYDMRDVYLGCECMGLDHVTHLIYWPPKDEDDDNELFFTVAAKNYRDKIFPYLSISPYDFKEYLRYHFFNRFGVALAYLFNSHHVHKWGILSSSDFRQKDLPTLIEYLSWVAGDSEETVDENTTVWLRGHRFNLRMTIDRYDKDMPWELGWEIQFKQGKSLWRRLKNGWRYIWGLASDEVHTIVTEKEAKTMKAMAEWVKKKNEELTEDEQKESKS